MKSVSLALALAIGTVVAASAQDTLGGKWTVHLTMAAAPGGFTPTGGSPTGAVLTLTVHGDSVTGSWQATSTDSSQHYPVTSLVGTVAKGEVTLLAPVRERTLSMPDGDRIMRSQTNYRFALQKGQLVGSIEVVQLDSDFRTTPATFTADRVR